MLRRRRERGWLNLSEFSLLFVLQNAFDLAPPYGDYTRRVCDGVQEEGKFGWKALENAGDGAV